MPDRLRFVRSVFASLLPATVLRLRSSAGSLILFDSWPDRAIPLIQEFLVDLFCSACATGCLAAGVARRAGVAAATFGRPTESTPVSARRIAVTAVTLRSILRAEKSSRVQMPANKGALS